MSLLALYVAPLALQIEMACDGVTYASNRSALWVPTAPVESALGIQRDSKGLNLTIGNSQIPLRKLYGTSESVARVGDLRNVGAEVSWDSVARTAVITYEWRSLRVLLKGKRVSVSLADQTLTAYQGSTLVLKTNVSTGRRNHRTPKGDFVASSKSRMHYSRLYDFSPMPFSIQVRNNIFLHGYHSVPKYPASHGCVRLPILAAKSLFEWIEIGVPTSIR